MPGEGRIVYRVRLVWDLPADSRVYEELGRVLHRLSAIVAEMRLEHSDSEGMVFEVEPLIAEPYQGEDEWLDAVDEAARGLQRLTVIVERGGVPIYSSVDRLRARLCPDLEVSKGVRSRG